MVGLVAFLDNFREELEQARANAQLAANRGSGIMFGLKSTKLELSITTVVEADGKLSFKVLGIGADLGGGASHTGVQTVTIELDPVDAKTGSPLQISSKQAGGPTNS